jgi:hypothetical protein
MCTGLLQALDRGFPDPALEPPGTARAGFNLKPLGRPACCLSGALRPSEQAGGFPLSPALAQDRTGFSFFRALSKRE